MVSYTLCCSCLLPNLKLSAATSQEFVIICRSNRAAILCYVMERFPLHFRLKKEANIKCVHSSSPDCIQMILRFTEFTTICLCTNFDLFKSSTIFVYLFFCFKINRFRHKQGSFSFIYIHFWPEAPSVCSKYFKFKWRTKKKTEIKNFRRPLPSAYEFKYLMSLDTHSRTNQNGPGCKRSLLLKYMQLFSVSLILSFVLIFFC